MSNTMIPARAGKLATEVQRLRGSLGAFATVMGGAVGVVVPPALAYLLDAFERAENARRMRDLVFLREPDKHGNMVARRDPTELAA